MSYPCLQVGLLHQLVRRAHKFLTDERKVKEKCFFFTCLSTSEYPRVGYPRCFLVILFPFLHTQELDLSAFYRVGFVLPCASVCPVYTPFNHWVPNPFLSIGVLIKKKKKSSHTEPPTVSGLVQSLFGSNSLYPPHPQPPRPKIHPPRVSFEGGGAAIFFFF